MNNNICDYLLVSGGPHCLEKRFLPVLVKLTTSVLPGHRLIITEKKPVIDKYMPMTGFFSVMVSVMVGFLFEAQ